jgi:peroxiredoxin Q/BCP
LKTPAETILAVSANVIGAGSFDSAQDDFTQKSELFQISPPHGMNARMPSDSDLQPGNSAPEFNALAVGGAYDGQRVSLRDFRGKVVVLYFYPKDDTPGCTTQACGLRDVWKQLSRKAVVFGVSIDGARSHAKFIEKHNLPFSLLVDEDRAIVESYGVWVEKSMYGRKYMGTERSTFVIDPKGKIRAIHRKVKPADHAAMLLAEL